MESDVESWIKNSFIESFKTPIKALHFINEKKQRLGGKLYKYCPIYGRVNGEPEYAIDNLMHSILYMSHISDFNDPFDTYITVSMEKLLQGFVPRIVEQQEDMDVDDRTRQVIPLLTDLFLGNDSKQTDTSAKTLVRYLENHAEIFMEGRNKQKCLEEMIAEMLQDVITGKISGEEANDLSKLAEDPNFFSNIIMEVLKSSDLMKKMAEISGMNDKSFSDAMDILQGNNPELEKVKADYHRKMEEIKPSISDSIKKTRDIIDKMFFVTCFSASPTNALMWAHYANSHKGFCVEYDLYKCRSDDFLINLHPVIYTKNRAVIPESLFDLSDLNNIKISQSDESTTDLICALLKKSSVWSYEDEWRLILYDSIKDLNEQKFPIDCISKIIMGCRISTSHEDELTQICKNHGYHLSKMELDEAEYRLHERTLL